MTADRPTGLTVTPKEWRGDWYMCGMRAHGLVSCVEDDDHSGWWAMMIGPATRLGVFPTRAEAERAVEEAVMRGLGGGNALSC